MYFSQFPGPYAEIICEGLVVFLFELSLIFFEPADHVRVLTEHLFLEFLHAEMVPVLEKFDGPIRRYCFFRNFIIPASYRALGALQKGDSEVSNLSGEHGVIGEEANPQKLLEPELGLGSGPVERQNMVAVGFIHIQNETTFVDLVRIDSVLGGYTEVTIVRGDAEEWFYRFRLKDAECFNRALTHYRIADPCNAEIS